MIDTRVAERALRDAGMDGRVIVTGRWLAAVLEALAARRSEPVLDITPPMNSARASR